MLSKNDYQQGHRQTIQAGYTQLRDNVWDRQKSVAEFSLGGLEIPRRT